MKCPRPECGWEWKPKVASPRACPYCKRYLPRDIQPITSGELTELKREMSEPEAIYNNIPDDTDLPRDEDYCQDCGAIHTDCECEPTKTTKPNLSAQVKPMFKGAKK